MNSIVTINRQFGSGGREVAKRLADKLNFGYYDKQLLDMISDKTGIDRQFAEDYDEKFTRSYAYTFGRSFTTYTQSPNEAIQIAYTNIIKQVASTHDAVIVGRCANYILEQSNVLRVFIYSSSMHHRVERCFDKVPEDRANKTPKQMAKQILATDKQRAKYHEFYTGQNWSNMNNYNLCIDTSVVGIDGAVDIIVAVVSRMRNK